MGGINSTKIGLLAFAATAHLMTACDAASAEATTPSPAASAACSPTGFEGVTLVNATVLSAAMASDGTYTPTGGTTSYTGLPRFCIVKGQATPSQDSLINFELWVPVAAQWNGKFVATGNGGYSPLLNYADMAHAMRQGYATIGGDTGHQTMFGSDLIFGAGHPEKIRDWGSRSVHAIVEAGKAIIKALNARAASRSYFYGCSTGGEQAYAAAQRYPQDFDGLIAGAPANNRIAVNTELVWRFLSNHAKNDNRTPILTQPKLNLITNAAVAACDGIDGVVDGVMEDPRVCTTERFNIESLACKAGDAPSCLTAAELAAAKAIYKGPTHGRTGQSIYPGPLVGSESGWSQFWGTTEPLRTDFWRYWAFDNPNWDWWSFDFNRMYDYVQVKLSDLTDNNNTDLSAYKARQGKLMTYQGWIDPGTNALDTISYYEKVREAQGSQQAIDHFFRLFMVPGMGHCTGGPGTTNFGNGGRSPPPVIDASHDLLSALDLWVERGIAPDSIIASRVVDGATVRTRPLCPFPRKAQYKGRGSTDDASNFECR